jgi:hypothetical protein
VVLLLWQHCATPTIVKLRYDVATHRSECSQRKQAGPTPATLECGADDRMFGRRQRSRSSALDISPSLSAYCRPKSVVPQPANQSAESAVVIAVRCRGLSSTSHVRLQQGAATLSSTSQATGPGIRIPRSTNWTVHGTATSGPRSALDFHQAGPHTTRIAGPCTRPTLRCPSNDTSGIGTDPGCAVGSSRNPTVPQRPSAFGIRDTDTPSTTPQPYQASMGCQIELSLLPS